MIGKFHPRLFVVLLLGIGFGLSFNFHVSAQALGSPGGLGFQRPSEDQRRALSERLASRPETSMIRLLRVALFKDEPSLDPGYGPWRREFLQNLYKLDPEAVLAYLRSMGDELWATINPRELFDIIGWDHAHTIPTVYKQLTWYFHDAEYAKAMIWPLAWSSGLYPGLANGLMWFDWSSTFDAEDYELFYQHWKDLGAPLQGITLAMRARAGLLGHFARPERSLTQDELTFRGLLIALGLERDQGSLRAPWNRPQGGPLLNTVSLPMGPPQPRPTSLPEEVKIWLDPNKGSGSPTFMATFTPSGNATTVTARTQGGTWVITVPWASAPQGTTGITIKPSSPMVQSGIWPRRIENLGVLKSIGLAIDVAQGQSWALLVSDNRAFEQALFFDGPGSQWINRDYARDVRASSLEEAPFTGLPSLGFVGLWFQRPAQETGLQTITLGQGTIEYDVALYSVD